MKQYLYLGIISVLAFTACKKDIGFSPQMGDDVLHYDGNNISAPLLARGISYAAVKFDKDFIQRVAAEGRTLKGIQYYVDQRPQRIKVLVFAYNLANPAEPGQLLYERELSDISSSNWNNHELNTEVKVQGEGLWIAFEVEAGNQDLRVIGCDAGPRYSQGHGDIYGIFGADNPGWTFLYNFSDETVNINWNIRGILE